MYQVILVTQLHEISQRQQFSPTALRFESKNNASNLKASHWNFKRYTESKDVTQISLGKVAIRFEEVIYMDLVTTQGQPTALNDYQGDLLYELGH